MKQKWKWIATVIIVLLCLQACGKKPAEAEKPAATLPTIAQTEAAAPEARDVDFYSGTWAVSGINVNNVDFTVEQAAAMGLEELEQIRLVLASDGKAFIGDGSTVNSGNWDITSDGIQAGAAHILNRGDHLAMEYSGEFIYLEKISDDQTPPQKESAVQAAEPVTEPSTEPETVPPTTEAPTEPETTAPATEPPTEPKPAIRPEFKEAMDSYEAFYNEYCDFLEDYAENPTDLTLLSKYAGMLSKASEMDEKFNAWQDGDLSNEELKYYLDVNTRIQKRLVDLF